MKVTRRELAALVGTSGLALSAQGRLPTDAVRALLQREGGPAMFDDPDWLELLREAIELSEQTRAVLRSYSLAGDAEPAVTLPRD